MLFKFTFLWYSWNCCLSGLRWSNSSSLSFVLTESYDGVCLSPDCGLLRAKYQKDNLHWNLYCSESMLSENTKPFKNMREMLFLVHEIFWRPQERDFNGYFFMALEAGSYLEGSSSIAILCSTGRPPSSIFPNFHCTHKPKKMVNAPL